MLCNPSIPLEASMVWPFLPPPLVFRVRTNHQVLALPLGEQVPSQTVWKGRKPVSVIPSLTHEWAETSSSEHWTKHQAPLRGSARCYSLLRDSSNI